MSLTNSDARIHGKKDSIIIKILIAEDNVLIADMLENFLMSEDFDVCGVAGSVSEAVALADLHKPDLGIFDFRLADGECGAQIRPLMKDPDSMGILYVSGDPLNTRLTSADGEAYIQKPYRMSDLTCALHIIQEMKTNNNFSPSLFPKSFHLLENSPASYRSSA